MRSDIGPFRTTSGFVMQRLDALPALPFHYIAGGYCRNARLFFRPRPVEAEGGGFEPPVPKFEYVSLANWWFQPLTHPSKGRFVVDVIFSNAAQR